jgi:hypothetical protein
LFVVYLQYFDIGVKSGATAGNDRKTIQVDSMKSFMLDLDVLQGQILQQATKKKS